MRLNHLFAGTARHGLQTPPENNAVNNVHLSKIDLSKPEQKTKPGRKRPFLILTCGILVSGLITACGGSDTPNTPLTRISPNNYSSLKTSPIETQRLEPADEASLSLHIKNGIRINLGGNDNRSFTGGAANSAESDQSSAASDNGGFSSTNTVEQGVDEADFVKYDGSYLFTSTNPYWRWGETTQRASVRILQTEPDNAQAQLISEIELDQNNDMGSASELYLVSNEESASSGLVTLRRSWSYANSIEPTIDVIATSASLCFAPQENIIELAHYNLDNIEEPVLDWNVRIDGFLQSSRKIDNVLYLSTYHSPYIPGLQYFASDNSVRENNEDIIASAELKQLMPSISINGSEPQPLMDAEDCLLPVDIDNNHGFAGIASLVAIDLESKEILSTRCLNANTQGFYVSQNNLYIGASEWQSGWWPTEGSTVIHKFALNNGDISYRSTGTVPGQIGWASAAFRMQEFNNTLRVVTSWREQSNDWRPKHRLTVLEDSPTTDQMLEVAALPNSERPQTIGKPNEDIYAVRFYEDRAFIVTFERIDPLYVIDLSNQADPFIAGELEIPGFSTYLHPVGENYLLGLGQEGGNFQDHVKISLFDVSDPGNPTEVRSVLFDESPSYSEAAYDHHAITFLQSSTDQLRFTLPVNFYSTVEYNPQTSLQLFEINGLASASADLISVGAMRPDNNRENYWYAISRSVLHDEAVYHIVEGDVYAAFWSSPSSTNGPH